jgi:hypothetical protein
MNEQLPPVDLDLRAQLERRAAGRVPTELLGNVLAELDSVPVSRPIVTLRPRSEPRTAGALVGVAAVLAIVAALVAVPALQNGPSAPSGYPVDRALTTAELAAVMSGPALPTNTALVADVTIQSNPDVCPMDRYPTMGVIEGMRSQVCVVYQGLSSYRTTEPQSGVFAFRYLAPGVLGLVGEVTPASSRLAFHVADEWPMAGQTFVVEGWLGAQGLVIPCPSMAPGDILTPNGADCPGGNWLGDSASAPQISGQNPIGKGTQSLGLHGDARYVQAEAARQFDSIDAAAPVRGAYVVRSSTGACSGDPPTSSRGCGYWLVLAKLADITVPGPTPTPAASASATPRPQAPSGYPIDRALTSSELGRLLDAGSLKQYDTVVVDAEVTAEASGACKSPPIFDLEFAGFLVGMDPQVCVYAVPGATIAPGHLLLRVLAGRTLGYMLTLPDRSPFAYSATDAWPQGDFLVHGWLGTDPRDCGKPAAQPTMMGYGLFPDGRVMCYAALTATAFDPTKVVYTGPTAAGPPRLTVGEWDLPADGQAVDPGPLFSMPDASPVGGSVAGTYVVEAGHHCSEYGDCLEFSVLARLTDVALPEPTPTPRPTALPPATPATPKPSGYPTDRALTTDELGRFLQTDGVKEKVVVAQVSIGEGNCPPLGGYLPIGNVADLDSVCVVGIGDGKPEHSPASSSGVFAFRVLDSHTLGFMADVTVRGTDSVAYGPTDAWPTSGHSFLVTGGLVGGYSACPLQTPGPASDPLDPAPRCGIYWLAPNPLSTAAETPPPGGVEVLISDSTTLTEDGNHHPSVTTYLVEQKCGSTCVWEVMARLEPVALPAPSPTPAASPTASQNVGASPIGLWGSGDRPLTVDELFAYWRANHTHLDGQVVVAKGPFPIETGCWAVGASCALSGEVPEGYWVLRFDAQGEATVLGELSTSGSAFVWTIDGVKASSSLKPGDIVAVDGFLEYWLNFCDIQRVGGCSPSWIVRPDDNILFSIEVQEDAYSTFASSSSLGGPKVRGIYLVRVGEGNAPWTLIARLDTTGSTNP